MKYLTKNKHWELDIEYNIDKILYLLIDRPNFINEWGDLTWTKNVVENYRNYDLPAVVWGSNIIYWYKDNKWHRDNNKPSKMFLYKKEWWENNNLVKSIDYME